MIGRDRACGKLILGSALYTAEEVHQYGIHHKAITASDRENKRTAGPAPICLATWQESII